jgi:hypothetical protein
MSKKVEKAKQIINQERQAKLNDIIQEVNSLVMQKHAFCDEVDRKIKELLGDDYVITQVIAYKEV